MSPPNRFTGESTERMRIVAGEMVGLAPDVIFVSTNSVVSATLKATRSIPVSSPGCPIQSEAASSRIWRVPAEILPASTISSRRSAGMLDLLRQIAPGLRRVAVIHVPEIVPNVAFLRVVEAAAPAFDIAVTAGEVRNAADIERMLPAFAQDGGGGLIVTPSALTATRRDLIVALVARLGLPAIYSFRFYAASGGLMSYGIDQLELVRAAASYVDRILRGTNPGELPVQLPTKFELVINLKTAAALGLTVPPSLLATADEVID